MAAREILECSDCGWTGDPLEAFIEDERPTCELCPICGSPDTWRHPQTERSE